MGETLVPTQGDEDVAERLFNIVYHHCVTKYDPEAGKRVAASFLAQHALTARQEGLLAGREEGAKYISPDLAEVAGLVAAMHTKWMQRDEMMRQQGGMDLMIRMADLMDGIVDAVPELQRKLIAVIANAPSTLSPEPPRPVEGVEERTIDDAISGLLAWLDAGEQYQRHGGSILPLDSYVRAGINEYRARLGKLDEYEKRPPPEYLSRVIRELEEAVSDPLLGDDIAALVKALGGERT